MTMETLQNISEALLRCNKCGFCLAGCPIYKVTGIETTAARGRLALLSAVLNNELELDDLIEPISDCLTCNGCTDHCPAAVMTDEVIIQARAALARQRGQPWLRRFIFHNLLLNPSILNRSAQLLGWMQATRLPVLGRIPGISRLMGGAGRAEQILPRIRLRRRITGASSPELKHPEYRVAYFVGCATANISPQVAEAAIRVLNKHNVKVLLPDFVCCGMPAHGYGDNDSALAMAKKNVYLVQSLNVDAIITTCASCGSFLKRYPSLLDGDDDYSARAKAFASKVKDISEFLVGIGLATGMGTLKKKITYHDPCHLGRFQKVSNQPRQILKSIPGAEYIEMPESNMCCGAAGSYNLSHYELSMSVLERKMKNIARTGADLLITGCPGCAMQLAYGIKSNHLNMKSLQLVELLDQAYGAFREIVSY